MAAEAKKLGAIPGTTDMYDKASVDSLVGDATTMYFEGTRGTTGTDGHVETDAEVLARITSGKTVTVGSTAVIITTLESGKESRTAFTYDPNTTPNWKAMDGNYTADNVFFQEDLPFTANIGVKTVDATTGSGTLSAAGKNLTTVMKSLMAQQKYPSSPTQPSASISLTNAGSYEVGTSITPSWKATFSAGSYQYGPATGVTSEAATVYHSSTSDTDKVAVAAGALNNKTGSFDEIVVTSDTNFKAKLNWGSTASNATPVTNLGNDATVDQDDCTGSKVSKIAAKTNQTATSTGAITGYRMGRFYGYTTTEVTADGITSAQIRALQNKNNGSATTGSFTFTVNPGARCIVIAIAGNRTLKTVLNTTVNADMTSSFVKCTNLRSVCGADAPSTDNAGDYSVWVYTPAEAYGSAANLSVTIS